MVTFAFGIQIVVKSFRVTGILRVLDTSVWMKPGTGLYLGITLHHMRVLEHSALETGLDRRMIFQNAHAWKPNGTPKGVVCPSIGLTHGHPWHGGCLVSR